MRARFCRYRHPLAGRACVCFCFQVFFFFRAHKIARDETVSTNAPYCLIIETCGAGYHTNQLKEAQFLFSSINFRETLSVGKSEI